MKPAKSALSILKRARRILTPRRAWTKFTFARNRDRLQVDGACAPGAVSWCAIGACQRADDCERSAAYDRATSALASAIPRNYRDGNYSYNDEPGRRHREILAWFDRAILAEGGKRKRKPARARKAKRKG